MTAPATTPAQPPSFGLAGLLWLLAALAATTAVFWSGLSGELVYDDLLLISRNPLIADLSNLPSYFTRPYWDFLDPGDASQIGYWRPLSAVGHALAWAAGNGAPRAFHAVCLLTHLGATAVAFLLARRLSASDWVAGTTALLFGLHPTHVESVAWISALNDPLSGLFCLLSLFAFLRWRERGASGWPVAAALWFALGLLAKEMAATVIPLALAMDLGRRRAPGEGRLPTNWGHAYGPFLVVTTLYVVARMFVFEDPFAGFMRTTTDFGVGAVRLEQLRLELLGGLLELCALPIDLNLFRRFRPTISPVDPVLLRATGATVLTTLLGWWLWRRNLRPALAALLMIPAGFWPVLVSVQSLGRFPLSDRFLYLPVFGFGLLLACLARRALPRRAAIGGLLVVAALYAWKSHDRIGFWQDEETLFRTAAQQSPRSPYVAWGLGRVMLMRLEETDDRRYLSQAFAAYQHAQDLLLEAKEPDSDILASSRDFLQANLGLGWCYVHEGMADGYGSFGTAIAIFEQLAERTGEVMDQKREARSLGFRDEEHLELEQVYTALGATLVLAGRMDEAEAMLRKALVLAPRYPEAHQNLGRLFARKGEWRLAVHHFERASELRPGSIEDRVLLAQALQTQGESERAEELALELVERAPDQAEPMAVLATIRLARRDGREALVWIDRALRADPAHGHSWYLKAKALLLLDVNQQAAIEAFRRATELMPDNFEANYDFGAFLLSSGATEAALPYLVRAYSLALDPRHVTNLNRVLAGLEYEETSSLLDLARIDEGRGRGDLAEFWVDRALALEPDSGPALFMKGRVLRGLERGEEALAHFRRAAAVLPDDFLVWSELGGYLAELGATDEALEVLERTLELDPPRAWAPELKQQAKDGLRRHIDELRGGDGDPDGIGPVREGG